MAAERPALPQVPAPSAPATDPRRLSYRYVLAFALAVTIARSAVFVFWEGSHFDANQAVFGLMAKHIAEGRAFPVFMYGQNYMLAVEAWLAAPLFAVAGASVTALKLPLLAMNLVAVWLLVRAMVHEGGLSPVAAAAAAVFLVLPGPGTTGRLIEASGGTFEPILYVLLLWTLRERPVWYGLVLGVGVLNREFTLYGFAALLVLDTLRGRLFTRAGLVRVAILLASAAVPYAAVQAARPFGPAVGPGTTPSDLRRSAQDVVEVADRLCIAPTAVPHGYLDIARVHWPLVLSTEVRPVREFDIESDVVQGAPWAGAVLALAMLLAFAQVVGRIGLERRWRPEYDVFAYLVLAAAISVSSYVVFRCGVITFVKMRYDLLSLLGAAGLSGWFLATAPRRWVAVVWGVLVLAWTVTVVRPHAELLAQYLTDAPVGGKRTLVRALEAHGVHYAMSSYAWAYPVTFLSDERIIVASNSRVRIIEYQREYSAHRGEAVAIRRSSCPEGKEAMAGAWLCPP